MAFTEQDQQLYGSPEEYAEWRSEMENYGLDPDAVHQYELRAEQGQVDWTWEDTLAEWTGGASARARAFVEDIGYTLAAAPGAVSEYVRESAPTLPKLPELSWPELPKPELRFQVDWKVGLALAAGMVGVAVVMAREFRDTRQSFDTVIRAVRP